MKQWVIPALLTSIFMLSQTAFVSASGEDEITVLETLIVTDSGLKTTLLNTNASIHVLTAKDIANSPQKSAAELISSIPGVINQKAGSQTYFSIRGTKTSMSGGPKIYIDGRPLNVGIHDYSKIDSIPLANIEKIEVIKSPSTAKYGASAGRGVILITTKKGTKAENAFSGMVSAEYGSWKTRNANVSVSGKVNRIDYNVAAYIDESDGYRESEPENKNVDVQVGWEFDGGRIDWITGYNKAFNKYAVGLTQWQVKRDRTVGSSNSKEDGSGYEVLPNESDEDFFSTLLRADYDKNNWLFNSSLGFSRDNQDFSYKKYLNNSAKLDDNYNDDRVENLYDLKAGVGRVFAVNNTVNTLTVGMDYKHSDFEQDRIYPFDPDGNNDSKEAAADIDAEKQLLGINLNHDLSWNLFRLQTGLRYNSVSYDLENRTPDSVRVDYDNDFDWSISPSISLLDTANLFVTWNYSNFYLPLSYYASNLSYDNDNTRPEDLDPETYDTVEAGWKHQMNKAFNYSLIAYYTKIENKIVSYYEGTKFKGRRNAGTSVHKGFEAEIDGRPLDWMGYRISFTTMDAEWDKGTAKAYETPDAGKTSVTDLSGKKVNYVPEYEHHLGLDFYPMQHTRYGSVIIALDVRGFGRQYEDYNNNLRMPSAHFLDARMTWMLKGLECYLTCTNLFDKEWDKLVNGAGKAHERFTATSHASTYYPQDGRYVGFGVTYRF